MPKIGSFALSTVSSDWACGTLSTVPPTAVRDGTLKINDLKLDHLFLLITLNLGLKVELLIHMEKPPLINK